MRGIEASERVRIGAVRHVRGRQVREVGRAPTLLFELLQARSGNSYWISGLGAGRRRHPGARSRKRLPRDQPSGDAASHDTQRDPRASTTSLEPTHGAKLAAFPVWDDGILSSSRTAEVQAGTESPNIHLFNDLRI
jgi:hypothetical protein